MSIENNKRIAKNTLFLYFRMILTMLVSLYASRLVLNTLGVVDFGIYNVVGGIVMMFSFLNQSMAAATQRYLSIELGNNDFKQLKKVFYTSNSIHCIIAIIILILAETIGLWFLNTHMNIPLNRMEAVNWVYQCSILSFMVTIISVPYNASIIAHEHMKAFAYVSILEVTLKLIIVFLLILSDFDKLITYSILLLVVSIIISFVYGIYCKRNFQECRFQFNLDKDLFNNMMGFSGWNLLGAGSFVAKEQGVNIVLNIFCGAAVNASRGIAYQVKSAIQGFVSNFQMAINPQITKSYALGNFQYMRMLIIQGARLSFYMLIFLSLPVLIETETILRIWLKVVPDYAIIFVRLVIISALVESLCGTFITAMLATGRIRNYEIVLGGLQLMNLPISYIFLYLGYPPQSTMVIAILISIFSIYFYLWFLRRRIQFSVGKYLKEVLFNVFIVSTCGIILPLVIYQLLDAGVLRLLTICIVSVLSMGMSIYYIGFSSNERFLVKEKLLMVLKKIIR